MYRQSNRCLYFFIVEFDRRVLLREGIFVRFLQRWENLKKVLYFFSELKYNTPIKQNTPAGEKKEK